MSKDEAFNMRLIARDPLNGFGNGGEGISLQIASDGRRILWVAHESAPVNFTGIDVSDPRQPRVISQTELPHNRVRSNSLEVTGDILAVAYQTAVHGEKPAGIELFNIADPETPKPISFFDRSGPHSRGVHALWFVDGNYIHCTSGAEDFTPRNSKDDQIYTIIDVRNLEKPVEVGRWWYPGTKEGESTPLPPRHPQFDSGFRMHNTNVYPDRPDRAYLGCLDGGTAILDISDLAKPALISNWNPHPPYPGFCHTALPLLSRDLLIVTDECVRDNGLDWPKLTWVVDIRDETNPIPISTFPMPPVEDHGRRGGRYGSHNLHENRPGPAFRSDTIIFATFFNGGVRAYDTSNPFQPKEIASYVPAAPDGAPTGAIQINDVYVDEKAIVYAIDRHIGGLYVLEADI
jgi:hypothetical protein